MENMSIPAGKIVCGSLLKLLDIIKVLLAAISKSTF
jgi:hypothetical protein